MKPLSYFSHYKSKNYLHLDKKVSIRHVYEQIQNPELVGKHAFLPFIHYSLNLEKYTFKEGIDRDRLKEFKELPNYNQNDHKCKKPKKREINYASHYDSYIYKYYGELLNEKYNEFMISQGIDECAIAYRNNKKGKNNIHFAKEVFKFILERDEAIVIALDFSSFFDNISHKSLKDTMKQLLEVEELPRDIYNVFKSITKYRSIEKEDLDKYLVEKYGKKELGKLIDEKKIHSYMDIKEFRHLLKTKRLKVNPLNSSKVGIPQGSGISAVCSNIRLINFDKEMYTWTESLNGIYRRYCDDLIWVIPKTEDLSIEKIESEIYKKIDSYGDLILQKEKTIILSYENNIMLNRNYRKSHLDYLGFLFDGSTIKIREKSLFKYFSRAYKKVRVVAREQIKHNRNAYMKDVYSLYTHLGFNYKGRGNFITYALKAQKLMEDLPVNVQIKNQVKRHWKKIHKKLDYYKSNF
ncbi:MULTISPECIES: RNA-dependent RNA polymerase family protein [Exiguobacterium]|uniref:hypothetical protein n=1 Tax=Exiguobacterium TaxID=33986 RepID=UPI0004787F3D|nr:MULTISPECIES: hypothetical protein [Exiguobacterium]